MLAVLIHSSKTMRVPSTSQTVLQIPKLIEEANTLVDTINSLSVSELARIMKISDRLAINVSQQFKNWTDTSEHQQAAVDAFLGDIYSGLQVHTFSASDRAFANNHLRILSGLYGILKPLDGIMPYRLEMAYKLPLESVNNLYDFWGKKIAYELSGFTQILNLSAIEYSKTVTPYNKSWRVVTPRFLTINPTTNQPRFIVVHAKIARGAFAHWVIKDRITSLNKITAFNQLGYAFDAALSTDDEPVFVCKEFQGLGLSVRLS